MSFVSTDPQSHEGLTNTWLTPMWLINSLGEFDLDPCGYQGHQTAKKLICLPENGLTSDWEGRVWLNPPYGKNVEYWLMKLENHGNGIALIFGRLETKWLQPFLKRNGFFILEGRISFIPTIDIKSHNAGSSSILIPFGRKNIGAILSSDLKGVWKQ